MLPVQFQAASGPQLGLQQKYNGSKDSPSKVALVPADKALSTFGDGFPQGVLENPL
jgi:hypothetical protein